MAGPWEQFQTTQQSGPWEQFQPELTQDEQTAVRVQAGKGTVQTDTPAQAEAFRRRRVSRLPGRAPGMVTGFPNLPGAEAIIGEAGLVGAYPQIAGGITAVGRRLYDALAGRPSQPMSETYARERDVARASINQERQDIGALSLPSDLVAGAALPVPFAQRMYAAAPAGAGLARRALTGARNLAATGVAGGTFGGVYGANIETGSWEDKARRAREDALLGALVGPVLHAGISGGTGLVRGARRLIGGRPTPAVRERVADWEALGIEPPTSVLAGSGTQQVTSRLARTPMGGRTRRDVALGEQRLQTQLGTELPPVDVSTAGEMAQAGTRRGLTISRSPEEITAMAPEELARVSGVGREGPPSVPGVLRRPTEVDVEARAQQYVGATTTRPVRVEDVPLSSVNAARLAEAEKRIALLSNPVQQSREEQARQTLITLMRERDSLAAQVQAARDVGLPASEVRSPRGSKVRLTQHLAQAEAAVAAAREALSRLPLVAARQRLEEVRNHIQQVREEAIRRNVTLQSEEFAANVARARIRARAELEAEYQQAAQQEQARAASLGLPASRESFATQLAAGERALAARAPATQQPLLAQPNSSIRNIMTDIGEEARSMGLLPGFKAENVFDANTGEWNAGLQGFLRSLVGSRIVQTLNSLSLQFQRGRIGQGVGGTGNILRIFEEVRARTKNPEVLRVLQRLEDAIRQDLERVAGQTAEGTQWLRAITEFRAVRDRIARELEEPLQEVLGTTNPAAVIRILMNAARPGGNIRTLDAFLRVAEAKGDRSNAVSLVLQGLRGNSVQEFARNYRALTPEARTILFAGPTRVLGQRLERVARAAESLTKFEGAGRNLRARDLARLENLGLIGGLINPTTLFPTLKLALGAKAADVVLNSGAFRRWLLGQPIFKRNRIQSIAALAAIPAGAVGLSPEAWEAAKNALISSAEAAGPAGATAPPVVEGAETDPFDPNMFPTPSYSLNTGARIETFDPLNSGFMEVPTEPAIEGRTLPGSRLVPRLEPPEEPVLQRPATLQPTTFIGEATTSQAGREAVAQAAEEPAQPEQSTNPVLRILRGVRDAFIPAADASVIGPVGARGLREAGRPLAERLIRMAERLAARGVPNDEIVARGTRLAEAEDPLLGALTEVAPGQWGVEVSNTSSRVRLPTPRDRALLGEVLNDPELRTAYGSRLLNDVEVVYRPEMPYSSHSAAGYRDNPLSEIMVGGTRLPRRTVTHEVEHELQDIEDFPRGASVAYFEDSGALASERLPGETAQQAYERVGGEFYARSAADRVDLPAGFRRSRPLQAPADALLLKYETLSESRPRLWTPERLSQIAQLRREGLDAPRIAERLGTTVDAIRTIIQRYGSEAGILPGVSGRRWPVRAELAEPAEPARRGIWAREGMLERLNQLLGQYKTHKEIARELGTTPLAVESATRRYRNVLTNDGRSQRAAVRNQRILQRWKETRNLDTLAQEFNLNRAVVGKILRKGGVSSRAGGFDPAVIQDVLTRWRGGQELRAIGRQVGLDHNQVWGIIHHRRQQEGIRYRYRRVGQPDPLTGVEVRPRTDTLRRSAETVQDRQAITLERQIVDSEDRLRAAGRNPDEIAKALRVRFGDKVGDITGADIREGSVWWRIGMHDVDDIGRHAQYTEDFHGRPDNY